ncbi:MAG: hypothetical protein ACRDWG_09360 [Actinomycetes bacterium]
MPRTGIYLACTDVAVRDLPAARTVAAADSGQDAAGLGVRDHVALEVTGDGEL